MQPWGSVIHRYRWTTLLLSRTGYSPVLAVRTGHISPGSQNRTHQSWQSEQDTSVLAVRTGHISPGSQNRTHQSWQSEQFSQLFKCRIVQVTKGTPEAVLCGQSLTQKPSDHIEAPLFFI
ncbi:hypothetical protein BsWGS_18976 [Bradybaena similaris]